MIEIDARRVIFNILLFHDSFNLSQLPVFADAFKQRINEAYVDISNNAIFDIIEEYPKILIFEKDVISRGKTFGLFANRDFIDRTLNREFSQDICEHLHAAAKEIK